MLPQDYLPIVFPCLGNQNLWSCRYISSKTTLIFPSSVLDFRFHTVEKQSIINHSSYSNKSYLYLCSSLRFRGHLSKWRSGWRFLFLMFCLYTTLHNRRSMSSNFLVFRSSGGISLWQAAFLLLIFVSTTSSSSSLNRPIWWLVDH